MSYHFIATVKLDQCDTCGVLVGSRSLHTRTTHNTTYSKYRLAIKVDKRVLDRENLKESEDDRDNTS